MTDPTAPAAPAQPTPAPPLDATATLEAMSPTERQTWRETGAMPERPLTADAPEPDDEPEPAAAPVTAAPAAEPAIADPAAPKISKRQQQINDLERRAKAAELRAQELEARLSGQPAAPAPATPQPARPFDGTDPADRKPTIEDFAGKDDDPYMQATDGDAYAARLLAVKDWQDRKLARVSAVQRQQAAQQTADQTRAATYSERCRTFEQAHPDFGQKTAAVRAAIHPQEPIAAWLLDSPVSAQVLDHLADHPGELDRMRAAGSLFAAHAAFVRLEHRFEASASPSAAAAPAQSWPPETSAPEPPTVLTGRGTAPADPVAAALRDKDTGRYLREANARELAASRRA